jgi:DNA polymerase I
VELESLASALFYMQSDEESSYKQADDGFLIKETTESGVQKRYVQHLVWTDDEDGGWIDTADDVPLDDPENKSDLKWLDSVTYETYEDGCLSDQNPTDNLSITGFEYVRSDSAQITRDAQEQIFSDILFAENPSNRIEPYLQDLVESIKNGDVSLEKLARPKGINNGLDEYGWKDYDELDEDNQTDEAEANGGAYVQKAGPTYRGSKYVDDYFSWEELGPGSKPRKVPIEKVRAPDEKFPLAYEYHSYPTDDRPDPPEVGDPVDAIAVEYPERVPDQFVIDYEQIVEKTLKKKLEGILSTMGMDWDDVLGEGSQAGLDQWM